MRNLLFDAWLRLRLISIALWTRMLAALAGVRIFIPIALIVLLLIAAVWF